MSDDVIFEKIGSYWDFPLYKKIYVNIVYWFKGFWLFLKCLMDYNESIKGNEFTILDAWGLCFSIQDVKMGKTYKMIFPSSEEKGDSEK